ncbi:MAG: ArsI/CadI family heavy metal resistance metalloenzyme [Gammaproteobacteria bacterium]
MKRLHVNLTVSDIEQSVEFYTKLFSSKPSVTKPDYAKWMLEDPRVNFSIAAHGGDTGIDHLGLQAEDEAEFTDIRKRLNEAEQPIFEQSDVTCCYARSTKAWVRDPDGVAWETFLTHGSSVIFGDDSKAQSARTTNRAAPSENCCS